jgi:AAA domain
VPEGDPGGPQYAVLKFAIELVKLRSMDTWPIVGRAEEQRFIADANADPDRLGVLVAGQAGVGKTRLMHEVLSTTRDYYLEWITASESLRLLPFDAFARLLPSDLHNVDQVDVLSTLNRHLQDQAEGRPIVLAVDDVHLLDGLSGGFIDHVATGKLATVLLTFAQSIPGLRRTGQTVSRCRTAGPASAAVSSPTRPGSRPPGPATTTSLRWGGKVARRPTRWSDG